MMWDRAILKSNAKNALRGRYWTAFLVTLIFALLTGWVSLIHLEDWRGSFHAAAAFFLESRGVGPLGLLYVIFIVHPLFIGVARYFVRNHFESSRMETMFSGFRWNYINGVGVMFLTRLLIALWTLLFVIPGLVKLLEYSMVPFLLSDNPSLPGDRAREISRRMTAGQKGAIFVFWLSFFGWFFLGALCAGVGVLFVLPYFDASQAELYLFLRQRALNSGIVLPEELCLTPPAGRP